MNTLKNIVVNLFRLLLAATLIVSGFVKAVDPLGTQYKIHDYLTSLHLVETVPDWMQLCSSMLLSAFEFCMGIFLLFAIRRRLVSRLVLIFTAFMTVVTVWVWWKNPVKDCGCFGDAIHLTNLQTLLKNIVLLVFSVTVALSPMRMRRFISKTNQWIVINYAILFILAIEGYSLYKLPIFDFRPYHVGTNILKAMEIPEGAAQPEFETTFILEKNGVLKELSLADYPDSTWTFITSKTKQTKAGYVPPIHDFSIEANGEDVTSDILGRKGYQFMLVSPSLRYADDSNFGDIDAIYEYAQSEHIPFFCLTSSDTADIRRWQNLTGAEYDFYTADETPLKTFIRSNPGLVLLKDGNIIGKWSHNDLPVKFLDKPLAQTAIGKMPSDETAQKILGLVVGFVLPLFLLTLADRLWAWTSYLKRVRRGKHRHQQDGNTAAGKENGTQIASEALAEKAQEKTDEAKS